MKLIIAKAVFYTSIALLISLMIVGIVYLGYLLALLIGAGFLWIVGILIAMVMLGLAMGWAENVIYKSKRYQK